MLSPRWQKVIRDLVSNKSRTLLVTAAIAVGVFSFGSVYITQETLLKNLQIQYEEARASDISIFLSDFDSGLAAWTAMQPGVAEAQARASAGVKMEMPDGNDKELTLYAVPDWTDQKLNLLSPEKGGWPPGPGEIILERNSLAGGNVQLGKTVKIKTNADKTFELVLAGSVYDNSSIPYIFSQQMTGYISWETLGVLGFDKKYNLLQIATGPEITTLAQAEKLTDTLTEKLKSRGLTVGGTMVLKPNQHWAADNSKAFTAILSVIGIFSLVLSGFLVVNTVSALLAQQKKQIGIMKAVGAQRKQIITLYLATVSVYGLLALVVAVPAGMGLGYVFLKMISDFLNQDIKTFYLPVPVFMMEAAAALAVPVAAAAIPVISGAKRPVREALSDFQSGNKTGRIDRMLSKITGLSLPILIALRNVFRKRGRLALTLGTLVTAGALFMGVINVRTSMYKEMDRILSMFDFEVSLSLVRDADTVSVSKRLAELPGVTAVEARTGVSANRIKPDGSKGTGFTITGLPPETVFSKPVVLSGRWLQTGDKDRVVLSSAFVRDNPDLTPGEILEIESGENKYKLEIVGVIATSRSQVFTDFDTAARIKDKPDTASSYLLKTEPADTETQNKVLKEAEDRLSRSGLDVAAGETRNVIYNSAANQFNFLIFFLLAMAIMVAVVGGLGLAGTMSLNVMERTREIGIMRSIGAGDANIRILVLIEGLLTGFLSWLLALPLSVPLTWGFCYFVGNAFFERTLVFSVVPGGMMIWLGVVAAIAAAASLLPAANAAKMSISETLSYE